MSHGRRASDLLMSTVIDGKLRPLDKESRREIRLAAGHACPSGAPRQAGAWYKPDCLKIGCEISFNRCFYKPRTLRPLEEIRADLPAVEKEAERLLEEILRKRQE